jgi:hypothetical protein
MHIASMTDSVNDQEVDTQGNRFKRSSRRYNGIEEVILVRGRFLRAILEADGGFCLGQQVEIGVLNGVRLATL